MAKMSTESKIFALIGVLVIIGGIAVLAWVCILNARCDEACGIRRARLIDGVCYCATEPGWERATERGEDDG